MACQTVVFVTLLSFGAAVLTRQPSYFSYDDCNPSCIATNVSCLIDKVGDTFPSWCVVSQLSCTTQSSSRQVCLRPELPPLGGEAIWQEFKNKYHPPEIIHIDDSKLLHFALAGAGALLALFIFLGFTVLCMMYEKRRRTYEPFINHSPAHAVDNPYMPTTEPIP